MPPQVARRLTRAYLRPDTLRDALASSTPCLVDEKATLHSPAQAALGRLLVNNDPALATAARSAGGRPREHLQLDSVEIHFASYAAEVTSCCSEGWVP